MKKLKSLLSAPLFWIWFLSSSLIVFVVETFLLGLWRVPIIGYQVSYMEEISGFDFAFVVVFALVFGFGLTLFFLARRYSKASCAVGSVAGLTGFFTMLCPVCPIFFLSYFGLSASLLVISPYFWWMRLGALILAAIGIFILWGRLKPIDLPTLDTHSFFQKFAVLIIALLLFSNQVLAVQIGQKLVGPQPGEAISLSGDFANDIAALVTPVSSPFYGPELGLDFSNLSAINASISKMAVMAPLQGSNPIELTDAEMKRYVTIGTEPLVTCEFCCGVKTLVREDGSPTCGCAHSIAMRGTAAYLIISYPEMTNAEISYELMRQKGLYFPGQMQERMASELAGDLVDFTADIKYLTQNLSESELVDLQQKAQDSGFVPGDNPGMVGGC